MAKASLVSRKRKWAGVGKRGSLSLEPTEGSTGGVSCALWDREAETRDGSRGLRGPVCLGRALPPHAPRAHEPPGSKDADGSKVEDTEGVRSSGEDLEVCHIDEERADPQN